MSDWGRLVLGTVSGAVLFGLFIVAICIAPQGVFSRDLLAALMFFVGSAYVMGKVGDLLRQLDSSAFDVTLSFEDYFKSPQDYADYWYVVANRRAA